MTGPMPPQNFIDTLNAITGKPLVDVRRPSWLGSSSAAGEYRPLLDAISVSSDQTGADYERDRAHEAGHRVDPAVSFATGDGGAMKQAYSTYLAQHPNLKPTGYAASSSPEQFAEAFADATDLLRRYAKVGPGDPHARAVALADAQSSLSTPGTAAIVGHLLTTPLYANHPLRGATPFAAPKMPTPQALPLAPAESTKQAAPPGVPSSGALPLAAMPLRND